MAATKTVACWKCGERIDREDSYPLETDSRKWVNACEECYRDSLTDCTLCEDGVEGSRVSDFILVKAEFGVTGDRPPGIYRTLDRPFYTAGLIGSGWLTGYQILFVDRLPKADEEWEISGHICTDCAKPYEAKLEAAYGPTLPKTFDGSRWEIEKAHTRNVILANPDMLRDLECDANDHDWLDIKKLYDLPDLPTFHEWLFVEHKGVKVFRTIKGWASWLTLRPEPTYRNSHKQTMLLFAPSGLPTYEDDGVYHYGKSDKLPMAAVKAAIDAGILTQDGILRDGQVVFCG